MTWALALWSGYFLAGTIVELTSGDPFGGAYALLNITIWFLGFVVLSLIWLMTQKRRPDRICPACGEDVKKGLMACATCGYNFASPGLSRDA
jgi:hypothetical protein